MKYKGTSFVNVLSSAITQAREKHRFLTAKLLKGDIVNNETKIALITLTSGLLIGAASTYVTISNNDAIASERIIQLGKCTEQNKADIRSIRIQITRTEEKIHTLSALHVTIKELTINTGELAKAIVRLEERQKNSDNINERLTKKIEELKK
jgi:hypothetical protein